MKIIKSLILITACSIFAGNLFAQQIGKDPEAQKILDIVSQKAKNYNTIKAQFTLTYKNNREEVETQNDGLIFIQDSSYVLETMGSKVIFDGENMYTIMDDINEITITKPANETESFMNNPVKIFTWYNRDFKYRYKSTLTHQGKKYHEIDLYPENLDQPYSRITLLINADNYNLYQVHSVGKDGEDYIATINMFEPNVDLDHGFFEFNKTDYPNAEIIDMRF